MKRVIVALMAAALLMAGTACSPAGETELSSQEASSSSLPAAPSVPEEEGHGVEEHGAAARYYEYLEERSEVCLRYARELELQLIVCVPDERLQSLIRNVDCVYGFRRHKNQISMMHIDKGDYLRMVEGEPDGGEEAAGDAGEAVDPEDGYGGLPGGETDGLEASGDHAGNY